MGSVSVVAEDWDKITPKTEIVSTDVETPVADIVLPQGPAAEPVTP